MYDQRGAVQALFFVQPDHPELDPPHLGVDLWTHPDLGEQLAVLDDLLLRAGVNHAREWVLTAHPDGDAPAAVRIDSFCFANQQDLPMAFSKNGFHWVRSFYQMEIEHSQDAPKSSRQPVERLQVRQASEGEWPIVHRLIFETFADHWDYAPRPYEQWLERAKTFPGFDPTQLWIASMDGDDVGVCVGDTSKAEQGGGYIRTLGVVRRARGLGVARTLLRTAFAEHVRRGWTQTSLGVDASSPTGATALYASVGMRETEQFDVYRALVPTGQ